MLARDGLIFRDSAIRAADVRDGLSHTLAVGESQPFPNGWNTLGVWYNGIGLSDGQHLYGAPEVALGTREINLVAGKGGGLAACPAGPYGLRPGRADDICSVFQFWSGHRGGANFLMADGAVRFLTYEADPILPALGTRSGGEPAPVPGN
jgi:prepilin-type processing-associated H-X9-DG protein